MPFTTSSDYWIDFPGGRYTLGLLPDEARRLAEECAREARREPPTPSLNDAKNIRRLAEWEQMDCNVEWLTNYLLAHYPAREVEIQPFAIARHPVTNAEYRTFMAETGEFEPGSWSYPPSVEPGGAVLGVDWVAAVRFVEWAGARLPFEAEWEYAMRGAERRLFVWGDKYSEGAEPVTPSGIVAPLANERCADIWEEVVGIDLSRWNERTPLMECRCVKGGGAIDSRASLCSPVSRTPSKTTIYGTTKNTFRLVRADGRSIPSPRREVSRHDRAMLDVRNFEMSVVRPTLERLRQSDMASEHAVDVGSSNPLGWWLESADYAASKVKYEVASAIRGGQGTHAGGDVRAGFDPDPAVAASRYNDGFYLVARSRETFRRHPPEHGVFVWGIGYRLAEDGTVRARHVAGFRIAADKYIHTLTYKFREGEVDTPLRDITSDLIASCVLAAFQFYEEHADADVSPF